MWSLERAKPRRRRASGLGWICSCIPFLDLFDERCCCCCCCCAMGSTIEGYLYTFGASKAAHLFCIPTFCVLSGRHFAQLRHKGDLVPLRSGILDANHRIEDTGRQLINGKILYTIRLYSLCDYSKEVLLGASSSEETAEWRKAFLSALEQPLPSTLQPQSHVKGATFPIANEALNAGERSLYSYQRSSSQLHQLMPKSYTTLTSIGTGHSMNEDFWKDGKIETPNAALALVGSIPKWRLVRSENGLRYFEEIYDKASSNKLPVMKAVGVVKAQAYQIFDLIMSYGSERCLWDHTFLSAKVIQVVDGHSDTVHVTLRQDSVWLRPRDLYISRYWKREDNGEYAVFYRSESSYPAQAGHVRAKIQSGGYIITPLQTSASGKPRSLVEKVLEMDVAGWSSWVGIGFSRYPMQLRDSLLSVVAGIREYFSAQQVDSTVTIVRRHLVEIADNTLPTSLNMVESIPDTPFLRTDDVEDFYDARTEQLSDSASEGHLDLLAVSVEDSTFYEDHIADHAVGSVLSTQHLLKQGFYKFSGTLPWGPLLNGQNCCSQPDTSSFMIRGKNFCLDGSLIPGAEPICQLLGVDWLKSKERIDCAAQRCHSILQNLQPNPNLFLFVVNLQVVYTVNYSLVFYFATTEEISEGSLLHQLIHGDDSFRNKRLTLIPSVPEGSWIVKQAVGSRPVALGQILESHYHIGHNYFEVDVNMGSSGVVRGVMSMVFGYVTALVVDMAFLIRAETEDELPECLLGAVRCSRLKIGAATDGFSE
ncbi:hypothetical protein O6H91_02G122100 [Diphasiastrum complanatum]|uniref:Uncharacterized protein n=1 Tax=Diphasiastrum complanatum TaxID=34168 RepID=A0ACC2EJR6_DIPCM|nr:hypothetical protein O6H91_02G122100 [Diphasiastrum complanatum]